MVFSLICLTILQYVYTSREWDKAEFACQFRGAPHCRLHFLHSRFGSGASV
jgi:hypothetical protein